MAVNKGDMLNLEITGMNHEGQGVGRVEGMAVFVDEALVGEVVTIKIKVVKKNYAVGEVVNLLRQSMERAMPFCPVYDKCGGCHLQHMSYRESLKFKTDVVRESLKRIGKLGDVNVKDTIGMEEPFNYRNKAQFPFGMEGGRPISGLYAKRSHDIVDFMECAIQMNVNDKIRKIVDEFMNEYSVKIYDEATGEGHLRHLMIRVGYKSNEVMVVFVVNGRGFPGMDFLIKRLVSVVPDLKSVYVNVNRKRTNVILGEENILVYGKKDIIDYLNGFKFSISPLSFYQVNPVQTEVLYGKVLEYVGESKTTGKRLRVFDLYCGVGTISLLLSRNVNKVVGVEVVKEAVRDAEYNAELNSVSNVEFIVGKAEEVIPSLVMGGGMEGKKEWEKEGKMELKGELMGDLKGDWKSELKGDWKSDWKSENENYEDVVVVDPPRRGCDELLLETVVKMGSKRVVYVSCNPSTLARDLAYLCENGYEVSEVQPVDMFPWTRHVECVVLIERIVD